MNVRPLTGRDRLDGRHASSILATGHEQADHRLARVSGRRLHRRKLQIRERRELAPREAALSHNRDSDTELINNVEDFADPPTLGTVERVFKKIAHGTYVLTPYGKDTHGHFTHYYAATWKPYLVKFMSGLPPAPQAIQ